MSNGLRGMTDVAARYAQTVVAAAGVIAGAAVGHPATIVERSVELQLAGDSLIEREQLEVALEEPGDPADWGRFRIALNDNIELVECTAEVLAEDGRVVARVPRRSFEREESTGSGLYTSAWSQIIPFRKLEVGQRLRIATQLRHRLPYRASSVSLQLGTPQRRLQVQVLSGEEPLVWRLHGSESLFTVRSGETGLEVVAENLPAAGSRIDGGWSMLALAWDPDHTWTGVGSWYAELTAAVERGSPEVASLARSLCDKEDSRRQCLRALADHVRRRVRYEAVAIGPGGWTPSPASETLARGWGDCKDKSQLLSELLGTVGVSSHLVLIRAGGGDPVDPGFPAPNQFNHCIVAVPADQLEIRAEDPVADGLFLVDPTIDWGEISWLTPLDQGRTALVVNGDASRLLEVPLFTADEGRTLAIDGRFDSSGAVHGRVSLRLSGARAVPWLRSHETATEARLGDQVRMKLLQPLLADGLFSEVEWRDLDDRVPAFVVDATLEVPDAVRGEPGRRSVRLPNFTALPDPSAVVEGGGPMRVAAGVHRSSLRLELPEGWCPPVAVERTVANEVGRYHLTVRAGDGPALEVVQEVELQASWIEPERLPALRELALAESREARRRVRLRCE